MTGIQLVNLGELMAGLSRTTKDIQEAQKKAAKQMGITAKQNIQNQTPDPMHIKTGAWQRSWNYQIADLSDFQTELTVFSNGAEQYFYVQEALHHPGEIGWHKSLPELDEIYKKNMAVLK